MIYLFFAVSCITFFYSLILIWLHVYFPEIVEDQDDPLDGHHE